MSADGQGIKWRRNMSRTHERYRQERRQTDGRQHIAKPVNISSIRLNHARQSLNYLMH